MPEVFYSQMDWFYTVLSATVKSSSLLIPVYSMQTFIDASSRCLVRTLFVGLWMAKHTDPEQNGF